MSRPNIHRYLRHGTLPQLHLFEATARDQGNETDAEGVFREVGVRSELAGQLRELLLGACVGPEKRFESLEVHLRGLQLCDRRSGLRLGCAHFRLRLPDVFRPRSDLERSQLSL